MTGASQRPAGAALLEWASTPQGEEVIEGTIGGLLTGIPGFLGRDIHPGEAALQTAGAIAGGIALGMAGRRIGRWVGNQVNPGAVENPMLKLIGSIGGHETLGKMAEQNAIRFREAAADEIMDRHGRNVLEDAMVLGENDFVQKYPGLGEAGVTRENVARLLSEQAANRGLVGANAVLESLPVEQRRAVVQELLTGLQGEKLKKAREALGRGAVEDMDAIIRDATVDPGVNEAFKKIGIDVDKLADGSKAETISGGHVGHAIGRFAGDEIGILAGYGLGTLAAGAMGLESPKDREIARLQEQLAQR